MHAHSPDKLIDHPHFSPPTNPPSHPATQPPSHAPSHPFAHPFTHPFIHTPAHIKRTSYAECTHTHTHTPPHAHPPRTHTRCGVSSRRVSPVALTTAAWETSRAGDNPQPGVTVRCDMCVTRSVIMAPDYRPRYPTSRRRSAQTQAPRHWIVKQHHPRDSKLAAGVTPCKGFAPRLI